MQKIKYIKMIDWKNDKKGESVASRYILGDQDDQLIINHEIYSSDNQ